MLGRRMTETEQVVGHRLRKVPALAILTNTRRTMPLRQRRAVTSNYQRNVPIARRPQSQRFENHQLTRGVRKVILPPKHVRDTHIRVVDRIAKEKCGGPVSTPDYEVADVVGQETLRPVHKVHELNAAPQRHPKPCGRRVTLEALFLPL